MSKRFAAPLFLYGLLAAGCTVGTDYRRPALEIPAAYRLDAKDSAAVAGTAWWKGFGDAALDALIDDALRNNRDVRLAAARVDEYEARLAGARAPGQPAVGYSADTGRQQATRVGPRPLPPGTSSTANSTTVGLSASWELDLWGRIRRSTEAARADLLATRESRRGVVLTLVSELARGYVQLRNLDAQLDITRRTLELRGAGVRLFEQRFAGGVISEVELDQVRAEYESAAARVPDLEQAIAQQENALSVLAGRNPGPVPRGAPLRNLILPAVPGGLPSALIEQRPDLRKAEQDLVAANARVGAARARFFPTISLTGSLGTSSAALTDLFSGPAGVWNMAAGAAGPIFDGGLVRSNVRQAEAQRQQLLFTYEKAVQQAFREVNDALVARDKTAERALAQDRQLAALGRYAELARLRYEGGYTSYLEVLDAERGLFSAELSVAQTRADVFSALVGLYKALGGSWIAAAETAAGAP